jgi:hypothetical protein
MSAAALTPRVRALLVCDEAVASDIESGVFSLEGVRQQLTAETFPCRATLTVFLVLSSPRKGIYQGDIQLIHSETEKVLRYKKFRAEFEENNEVLPLYAELGSCEFPEPSVYNVRVRFSPGDGADVLKGDLPFPVLQIQE